MWLHSVQGLCFLLGLQLYIQSFPHLLTQPFIDTYYVPCIGHALVIKELIVQWRQKS